ncbi:MAG: DUF2953 domain-containing protein [Dehalobacterium sp.]|jgi:hypothetical protein
MRIAVILLLFLILMLLIGLLPLRFKFNFLKKEKDDYINISWLVVPGIWNIKLEIPFIKFSTSTFWPVIKTVLKIGGERPWIKKEQEETLDKVQLKKISRRIKILLQNFSMVRELGIWFLSKISLRYFFWCTEIGTKDAAQTGVLTGVFWSFKAFLYGCLQQHVKHVGSNPQISVIPDFQQEKAYFRLICIFDIRLGHIMIGGLKMLPLLLIKGKGGEIDE